MIIRALASLKIFTSAIAKTKKKREGENEDRKQYRNNKRRISQYFNLLLSANLQIGFTLTTTAYKSTHGKNIKENET